MGQNFTLHTLIVDADLFLREAREVDHILAIGVDIQEIDTRAEVLHQRSKCPRINGPVVYGLVLVELGVHRWFGFEGQFVGCSYA